MAQSDIPALVELARQMHGESPNHSGIPFIESAARTMFHNASFRPDTWFCALVEEKKELLGAMLACKVPVMFSSVYEAQELGLYVKPEYRGKSAAVLLVKEFEKWARHCALLSVGVSLGLPSDAKVVKFYERMGYTQKGVTLCKGN